MEIEVPLFLFCVDCNQEVIIKKAVPAPGAHRALSHYLRAKCDWSVWMHEDCLHERRLYEAASPEYDSYAVHKLLLFIYRPDIEYWEPSIFHNYKASEGLLYDVAPLAQNDALEEAVEFELSVLARTLLPEYVERVKDRDDLFCYRYPLDFKEPDRQAKLRVAQKREWSKKGMDRMTYLQAGSHD